MRIVSKSSFKIKILTFALSLVLIFSNMSFSQAFALAVSSSNSAQSESIEITNDTNETTSVAPISTIEENKIPLSDGLLPTNQGEWSLINILLTFGSMLLMIGMLISFISDRKKSSDNSEAKSNAELLLLLPGLFSLILLFAVEKFAGTMIVVNNWTAIFLVAFITQFYFAENSRLLNKEMKNLIEQKKD